MDLLPILGVVGTTVAIVTAGLAVALYVRGGYAKARIDALRSELEDERRATASLRQRVEFLETEDARKSERLAAVEAENRALRGAPQLVVDGLVDTLGKLDDKLDTVVENTEAMAAGLAAFTARGASR